MVNRGTEFPKYVYHQIKGPRIVQDREEQDKLGDEWAETPFPSLEAQEQSDAMGGVEGLTLRVLALEELFDKLKSKKELRKLFAEA